MKKLQYNSLSTSLKVKKKSTISENNPKIVKRIFPTRTRKSSNKIVDIVKPAFFFKPNTTKHKKEQYFFTPRSMGHAHLNLFFFFLGKKWIFYWWYEIYKRTQKTGLQNKNMHTWILQILIPRFFCYKNNERTTYLVSLLLSNKNYTSLGRVPSLPDKGTFFRVSQRSFSLRNILTIPEY